MEKMATGGERRTTSPDFIFNCQFEAAALVRARAEARKNFELVDDPRAVYSDLAWQIPDLETNEHALRFIPPTQPIVARGYLPLKNVHPQEAVRVFHRCPDCDGWVAGLPKEVREADPYCMPLQFRRPPELAISYRCGVCDREVARSDVQAKTAT